MTLRTVVLKMVVVITVTSSIGLWVLVGRERLGQCLPRLRRRIRTGGPYLLGLCAVLVGNSQLREIGPQVSWIVGVRITGVIESIEGGFVAWLQTFSHPVVTEYFAAIYVYGYGFLLVFPVVAYFVLADDRPFREATVAYSLNYAIGLVCYILFIAYGPRNVMPGAVDQLLYVTWPDSHLLTSQVNANVNVFPSLHTSLATTVAILAIRTRDELPYWAPLATVLALSVIVSTMYLGIHWATDVVAGVGLGALSVAGGIRLARWLARGRRQTRDSVGMARRHASEDD